MEAETPGAPQCMVAAGKRQRSDDTETPSPIDEQRPAKQSRPSPALLSLGLGSSCPGDDRGAALLGVGSSSSAPRVRPQETTYETRLRPIDTAYPRWICASKTAWKSIRASRRERRVAASADAQAAAAATAAAEVAEIEAAEAEAAENEAAVAAAAALAAPVSELETPIGLVQLGDSVEVKWSESDGDGKLYPATVVALTGGGVTVLYPETADWDEWEEQLAVEEMVPSRVQRNIESVEWVQCENSECGKWRILPFSVRASALPERFECRMCHWNERGASCDTPEDTVEAAYWLLPQATAAPEATSPETAGPEYDVSGAVVDEDGGAASASLGAPVSAMHLSTEQMLQELEAQAQQMLERRHHHKKQQQKQRQTKQRHRQKQRAQGGSRPGGAAQASLPLLQHPRALLPRALLPTDANDAAAHTDFAPLFAARSGLALPIRTPAIQQLCDVGVKPHLVLELCRFSVARHRLHKQKLSGTHDDGNLLEMIRTDDMVEILRTKSFCNVCRCLDRVSSYVIAEVIRPHALASPTPDLPGMLFNLCIVRAYINDSVRASFMGRFDFRAFDPSAFVRKVQSCLVLSGREPDQDIASSAYNVGTFRKYHAAGEHRRGSGTKKRSVAHFFALLAAKIPAAVAAMLQEPRSAEKTFRVLRDMLEIASFPAYNITLDLGYYDRTLCDEDSFHYIGPGACPAVHYLRAEPWREKWVQVTGMSSVKAGQRVRQVEQQLSSEAQQQGQTAAPEIKSEPHVADHAPLRPARGISQAARAGCNARWVYGYASTGVKARQASAVRVRWDAEALPAKADNTIASTDAGAIDGQNFCSRSPSRSEGDLETVVHSTSLFKRVLRPPVALTDTLYMEVMVAIREALPDLLATIGVDLKREFAGCPMVTTADGRTTTLNLQYVEGSLCEFRKYVTEQPELAALCGKLRARSGLKYVPKGGGGSGAAGDYVRWLGVVQRCVVDTWDAADRTDRSVWTLDDDKSTVNSRSDNDSPVAAAPQQPAAAGSSDEVSPMALDEEDARGSGVAQCSPMLHSKISARAAADLGEVFDAVDAMVTTLVENEQSKAERIPRVW